MIILPNRWGIKMRKIKFRNYDCIIHKSAYINNDRTAIYLIDAETSEPILTATVNVVDEIIEDDEVIIKNYSENDGILTTLVANGIVSLPIRFVNMGHVTVPVCKLLI